jgi:N-glycosylase/DNA lyase
LFAYGRLDVFPVDTWIRKIYSDMYLGTDETATDRAIGELARKRYGRYAGLAQQYLFEAARRGDRALSARQV